MSEEFIKDLMSALENAKTHKEVAKLLHGLFLFPEIPEEFDNATSFKVGDLEISVMDI